MRCSHIEVGKYYYWGNGPVLELVRRVCEGDCCFFRKRDGSVADVRSEDEIYPTSYRFYQRFRK